MSDLPRTQDVPHEVHLLIEGYCANTLGDEQFQQLESRLKDNPKLQSYFLGYLAVHSGLQWSLRNYSPELPSRALPSLQPLEIEGISQTTENDRAEGHQVQTTASETPSTRRRIAAGGAVLSVAAAVVLAMTLVPGPAPKQGPPVSATPEVASVAVPVAAAPQTSPPHTVARIDKLESQVLVERDGAKKRAVVGMEILSSDSLDVPTGSRAELTLADQSLATLGPRTTFAFSSSREAILREGFVQIDSRLSHHDKHLAIQTPDATTQIRSAWMSMAANGKRTQIRVAHGRVLASRKADGTAVEIEEGYCSTIAHAIAPDPRRSGNGTALFVVTAKALHAHQDWEKFDQVLVERILGDRLWRSAVPVRMRTYDELQASDLEDCSLVVLSVFPRNLGIEQKLIDLGIPDMPTPVVCLEPIGFPVLGLTGPQLNVDYAFQRGPLVVDVTRPEHPLAAGYVGKGLELFAYRQSPYGWGKPTSDAITVLKPHKKENRSLMFAYEQGSPMFKGIAPARRVALFMIPIGADYNSPGLDLMDAAIDWCLEPYTEEIASFFDTFPTYNLSPSALLKNKPSVVMN